MKTVMTAIQARSLRKEFGDTVAVENVTFDIERGEVFGFLGPNGAGKSTTINMLLDFVRPTSGTATIFGHDIREDSQAIRRRTGVLPEGFDLYGRLSGRKHVQLAAKTKGVEIDPEAILDRVGLTPEETARDVEGYSKGMQQRLALGMALVGDPDLLIMDEPSGGLDPTGISKMQQLVQTEAERGTTVFFSSHILHHVEEVCDRIGVMNEGTLVAAGTLEELYDQAGGTATVELDVEAPPERTIESLPEIDGVTDISRHNGTVRVVCERPPAKAAAIARVHQSSATVNDVRIEDRDIDDLFATLTTDTETDP